MEKHIRKFSIAEVQTAVWAPFAAVYGGYPNRLFNRGILHNELRKLECWNAEAMDEQQMNDLLAKIYSLRITHPDSVKVPELRSDYKDVEYQRHYKRVRRYKTRKVPWFKWRLTHDMWLDLDGDNYRMIANRFKAAGLSPEPAYIHVHHVEIRNNNLVWQHKFSSRGRYCPLYSAFKADIAEQILLSVLPLGSIE